MNDKTETTHVSNCWCEVCRKQIVTIPALPEQDEKTHVAGEDVVTWTMPREDARDLLRYLRHNRPLGMPDRTFGGLIDTLSAPSAPEKMDEKTRHRCPYPAGGCTAPDCHVTAGRYDDRVIEALARIDHEHRVNCTGPGEVGCLAYPGWHSWGAHRRHVAEAQLVELRRLGLLPIPPGASS